MNHFLVKFNGAGNDPYRGQTLPAGLHLQREPQNQAFITLLNTNSYAPATPPRNLS
jgi:hypothetical protein